MGRNEMETNSSSRNNYCGGGRVCSGDLRCLLGVVEVKGQQQQFLGKVQTMSLQGSRYSAKNK